MKAGEMISRVGIALFLCTPGTSTAANALIVYETGRQFEDIALAKLTSELTAAGYTVTPNVGVPPGLAGYRQVWDIRFDDAEALTPADISSYVAYMASGGSLFVLGDNAGYVIRNNSILALISAAGGGPVALAIASNRQSVPYPFTLPNPVPIVWFHSLNGLREPPGNGSFIAEDVANKAGTAIVWPPGSLSAAGAGTLIVVLDLGLLSGPLLLIDESEALLKNIIDFLAMPRAVGPAPIPALSTWAAIALALALAAAGVNVLAGSARAA